LFDQFFKLIFFSDLLPFSYTDDRISLAYENLREIPQAVVELYGTAVKILDLSHNLIRDLSFLSNFRSLNSLILDKNPAPDAATLPYLPDLELLW
jgi:leucine-rich melanocyte differentiation-associated protein